jgi:hypothetical protein
MAIFSFAPEGRTIRLRVPPGPWRRLVDSAEERFGGPGAKSPVALPAPAAARVEIALGGHGAALYVREVSSPSARSAGAASPPEGRP